MDFEERPIQPGGQHIARTADITLAAADDFQFDLDDPGYGFDLGPADGIGSQDYDLDLGLDFGDGPVSVHEHDRSSQIEDDSMSVGVGRDAALSRALRESLGSHLLGPQGGDADFDLMSNRSREPSEHPFGADMNMDLDFGPDIGGMDLDLGLDFGDKPLSEHAPTPRLTPSRACVSFVVLLPYQVFLTLLQPHL